MRGEVVVQAAGDEHHAGDLLGIQTGLVLDHRAERARGEVLDLRAGGLQPQQLLGGGHDQRLARTGVGLTTQHVEVVRRGRRLRHDHVALGAQREEALDAGRGVVRALTLVAVRQQHDQRRALAPLLLGRGDELVHDRLGAVDEVAELRLPHGQGVRALDGVAVLEAEHAVLGEQRVVDRQRLLVIDQAVDRDPRLAGLVVEEHRVALGERAALDVLARHPHRDALHQQGAEGHDLAHAPVDAAVDGHLGAALEQLGELAVDREVLRRLEVGLPDTTGGVHGDGGRAGDGDPGIGLLGRGALDVRDRGGIAGDQRGLGGLGLVGLGEHPLQALLVVLERAIGLVLADVAAAHEVLGVDPARGALLIDHVVHHRLGHRGVIALVVTAAAVADQVDHDVLVEALAVLEGHLAHVGDGLGVIGVDVEGRHLHGAGDVRGVGRGATGLRTGGEPDLVVHHDVHRAARGVGGQLGHLHDLVDHALTGHGGIAVDLDGQHREGAVALGACAQDIGLGAGDALDHRIGGLEVRRVGTQVDLGLVAGIRGEGALGAQVVLDVAGALGAGILAAVELAEDLGVGLAGDVRQHVEAPAVGHGDGHAGEVLIGGIGDHGVEQRDQRLAALQREALLADVLGLQEGLEGLGRVEAAEDAELLLTRGLGVALLQALLEELALLGGVQVHVLDADRAAVGITQQAQDGAQGQHARPAEAAGGPLAVQVPQRQAVGADVQIRVGALFVAQRVDGGHQVAPDAVGVDQLLDPGDLVDLGLRVHLVVGDPAHGLVGDPQPVEDLVPELVAEQVGLDQLQELAGAGALDDAVVVGRGQGDDLGDRIARQGAGGGAAELGGVVQRADAHDRGLALGQAGHGVHGADAAGVGQ